MSTGIPFGLRVHLSTIVDKPGCGFALDNGRDFTLRLTLTLTRGHLYYVVETRPTRLALVYRERMLIDLVMGTTIHPNTYRGTLVIRMNTDDRSECGIYAGRNCAFANEEQHLKVPRVRNDSGFEEFLIDRPISDGRPNLVRRYVYKAIGWDSGSYVEHPVVWVLTLQEIISDEGVSSWDVAIGHHNNMGPGFRLTLPDYKPGWRERHPKKIASVGVTLGS